MNRPTIPTRFGKMQEWQPLLSRDNASLAVLPDTRAGMPVIVDTALRDRLPDKAPQALQVPKPKTESESLVASDPHHDHGLMSLAHLPRHVCRKLLWWRK